MWFFRILNPNSYHFNGQIEQVMMNLATNARDAITGKGKLIIDIKASSMDEAFIRFHGYGKAGHYVALSVADTGVGMNEATKKRIFELFSHQGNRKRDRPCPGRGVRYRKGAWWIHQCVF